MGRNNQRRRAAKARQRAARRAGGGASNPWGDPEPRGRGDGGGAHAAGPAASPSLEERVADEVVDAVARLRSPGRPGADRAVLQVLRSTATTPGLQAVAARLTTLLTDCVALAWERGWQPADLHRLVGRDLDERAQLVLGDAMAHQLDQFAEATIAPRWPGQLREVQASTWWPRDSHPVAARAALPGTGPDAVVAASLEVAALLADLPTLSCLDPLPGTVHRGARASFVTAGSGAEVDERVLSRVRALLAKAESTTFEAEAETFTAGAQALMARHSIDAAMLAAGARRPVDTPSARRLGIDRPYEQPKVMLLDAVATANRCRTVWSSSLGFVTVIGFEGDLTATETIFTSLLVQATAAMAAEGSRFTRDGRSRTRAFRQSFLTAYAHRIGARLREVTEEETAAAVRASSVESESDVPAAPGPPPASVRPQGVLVRALAQRAAEVDDAVGEIFPQLVTKNLAMPGDHEGWSAGSRAADRATLFGAGRSLHEGRTA